MVRIDAEGFFWYGPFGAFKGFEGVCDDEIGVERKGDGPEGSLTAGQRAGKAIHNAFDCCDERF